MMELAYDSKIGRGSCADVWLAVDDLGRSVAVKFFNDTAPTLAEQNALSHAKALARVDCPTVVRILSLERQNHPDSGADCLAIIMEHVPGPSLSRHSGPFDQALASAIIRDVAIALEAIHSSGLVHGDLHDGNVLIAKTGAKVIDILYTHSLAEVGTKTANVTRNDDLRAAAVLFRQIVEKTGYEGSPLAEVYYRAATTTLSLTEMAASFIQLLPKRPDHRPTTDSASVPRRAITLASAQNEPWGLVLDTSHVYWTTAGTLRLDGTVMMVPKIGGIPAVLISGQALPLGIAVDTTHVYWVNGGTPGQNDGAVMKLSRDGGSPTALASDQKGPLNIAIDATNVYWTNKDGGTIMKVPIIGGAPTPLVSGLANPWGIALDTDSVYWTNYNGGSVMRISKAGGMPKLLASGQNVPWGIAVDAMHVYFARSDNGGADGAILRVPKSGGSVVTLASQRNGCPHHLALDGTHLYWGYYSEGTISKIPIAGGQPVVVCSGQPAVGALAVDESDVYWVNQCASSKGTVMKVPRHV